MEALINILVRTHRRPKGFLRLLESINEQTYKNYRVIVSVDDDLTYKYVKAHGMHDDDIVVIDTSNRENSTEIKDAAFYNTYFNNLIDKVDDGYIYCMDDDDYFMSETSLETIADYCEEDALSIFKMKIWGIEMPSHSFGKQVTLCDIGTPCFSVHHKWAKKAKWGEEYTADGQFIKDLSDIVPNTKWINKVIYYVPQSSAGRSEV